MKAQNNKRNFQSILRSFLGLGLLGVGLCVSVAAQAEVYATYPPVDYNSGAASPDTIKKGEYLAKMGDCIACHTNSKKGGPAFAGGLPIVTPFGTMYSMNITPDKETGIGTWSDEDFIRAMRHGKNPDGDNYFPSFPYMYFNKLNDEDIKAIHAYLKSIPAVNLPNKPLEMPWPFSWRFMQYGWKLLFFYPYTGEFEPDPEKSDQVNRGAYIVEGLGHCAMCHSPMNLLGAPKRKDLLAGGMIEGYFAPNITSYNLDKASEQDIVNVFAKGELLYGRGKVQGPMAEVNHDSLQYLTDEDLHAIAAYLKQVPPRVVEQSGGSAPTEPKKVYQEYCAACHASGSGGAPKVGSKADWDAKIALGMNTVYNNAIKGIGSMPPKGTCSACSDDTIKKTIDYMIAQSENTNESASSTRKPPATQAPALPAGTGKKIYEEACAACHSQGNVRAPLIGDERAWDPLVKKGMDVLFEHAIHGYHTPGNQFYMPAKGGCYTCTDAEVIAAVKYMADQSVKHQNYDLW